MKKIGLYIFCAIVGIVVISCGYCMIQGHIIQEKTYSYLETYGYTDEDIEQIDLKHSFFSKLLGYNEWRILLEFKKEPDIYYRFTYHNHEILKTGISSEPMPDKNKIIEYENMFENGELKYNSEKLEVSDMIYGDIIQEPQMVEAPEQNVRFPDSNPIYGGIGTHEIVGDKTIYYNDEYGISFRLWEEFSGGNIVERDTEEWDTINENLYKLHRIEVYKKDGGGEGYGQVFIINAVNNEQFNIWKGRPIYNENLENDVLGTNNKYSFWSTNIHNNGIVDITNEKVTDMYIFDVKENGNNEFLEDIKSSGEQPQRINDYPEKTDEENILVVTEEPMDISHIINLKIGNAVFEVTLEENSATKALIEKLNEGDVVVNVREYGGFEKVGNLGFDLPRADKQITTEPGDLVLYQGNQISLFYESNSWSYTKLGKVQMISKDGLKEILGDGDVTLVFSLLK